MTKAIYISQSWRCFIDASIDDGSVVKSPVCFNSHTVHLQSFSALIRLCFFTCVIHSQVIYAKESTYNKSDPHICFIIIFVHSVLVYYYIPIYRYIGQIHCLYFAMITDVVWYLELGTQVHLIFFF